MSTFFDDNDEQDKQEQKLLEFYQVYSADVRRRLLSKNVPTINNVYDVLYPNTKEALLSKNAPNNITIDSSSESIRNALLAKIVEDNINLEKFSENFRNSLLARNNLSQSATDLQQQSENVRKGLLSKNNTSQSENIDDVADSKRHELLSKNTESLNFQNDIERNNESFRENNLHKNVESKSDIETDSEQTRKNLVSKNKPIEGDLLTDSNEFRSDELALNTPNTSDLSADSEQTRKDGLAKNTPSTSDLLNDSEQARDNGLASNVPSTSDLEKDSEQARINLLASNKQSTSDLLVDSEQSRKDVLASNVPSTSDLLKDSEQTRTDVLASNVLSKSDLEKDSEQTRIDDLSKNKPTTSDLEKDSEQARINILSKNTPSTSDLLNDSDHARKNVLASNVLTTSDLEKDSERTRKNILASNVPTTSDLEKDSEQTRADNAAKNTPSESDLFKDSEQTRTDNTSKNTPNTSDLLTLSEDPRTGLLAANTPNPSDLLSLSENPRTGLLSANKPNPSDLLELSVDPRTGLLAANTPNPSDLLTLSQDPRDGLLSANVPNPSDLLELSVDPRTGLLAANVPSPSDLLNDSNPFYQNNLSANVPGKYDIDNFINNGGGVDSAEQELKDLKSKNIPTNNTIDKFVNNVGIKDTAAGELKSLLSENVPTDNTIDKFVNIAGAKDTAAGELKSLLSKNDYPLGSGHYDGSNQKPGNNINIFTDNQGSKNSANAMLSTLISKNDYPLGNGSYDGSNPKPGSSIDGFINNAGGRSSAGDERKRLMAMNPHADLGVTFTGLGTATFLGISKVLTQGLIIRSFLMIKNRPNRKLTLDNVDKGLREQNVIHSTARSWRNAYSIDGTGLNEYTQGRDSFGLTEKIYLAGTEYKDMVTQTGAKVSDAIAKQMERNNLVGANGQILQASFGISSLDARSIELGGGYFGVNSSSDFTKEGRQGGGFISNTKAGKVSYTQQFSEGNVTFNARLYNLSKNLYNSQAIPPGGGLTNSTIQDLIKNPSVNDLITQTTGYFHDFSNSVGIQSVGVTTSTNFLGLYYLGYSAEEQLRPGQGSVSPGQKNEWIQSAKGAMAKTVAGNPLDSVEFVQGQRGVRKIINTIKNNKDSQINFSENFNTQKADKFIIRKAGTGKQNFSRQRFTIANQNQYGDKAIPKAKGLMFSLKNYSSGDSFYFPPYIETYNDSHTANWNEINFLGRPEPIYTYNNSSRDGSITFFVLTDYTQNFLIGSKYNTEQGVVAPISVKADKHFTSADAIQNQARQEALANESLLARDNNKEQQNAITTQKEAADTNAKNVSTSSAVGPTGTKNGETAVEDNQLDTLKKESAAILKQQNDLLIGGNSGTNYSATNSKGKNVYFQNTSVSSPLDGGYVESTPDDTQKRIDTMVKNLMFQPAYFSGDKIDFLKKMDFLAKLTKPARAQQGSGFSFTRPPVAHIKLGDWWDHDIVVKSVSVDYKEAPWTLDTEGRVQPMWASVTLSFNFVGPYGGESGPPVVSTDVGGIYNPRG